MVLLGHVRLGKFKGLNGLYFLEGSLSLEDNQYQTLNWGGGYSMDNINIHRHDGRWRGIAGGRDVLIRDDISGVAEYTQRGIC